MSGVPGPIAQEWAIEQKGAHPCKVCGEPVNVLPIYFYMDKKIPNYCSMACVHVSQRKRVNKTCAVCGKLFETIPSKTELRITCSGQCYGRLQKIRQMGSGNTHWDEGGFTTIRHAIFNNRHYERFRTAVMERDGFCCQVCGKQGRQERGTGEFHAHHIIPIAELLSRIFDPDNGITCCDACHMNIHHPHD